MRWRHNDPPMLYTSVLPSGRKLADAGPVVSCGRYNSRQ
jgi:hypothetical protein